ncbi:MAG: invasion associated locus B family protein [Alphaproteobacteria bacterium]|jgi:invasion protein IalB|nr:invasion associated locus B family protein [Alphaproteobacteria bacterium]
MNIGFLQRMRVLALPLVVLSGAAAAQDRTMASFNDWQLRCEEAPQRQCEIASVANTAQGRPAAQLLVGRLGQQGQQVVAAVLPLGVHLPGQVRLMLGGETLRLEFQRCVSEGCIASAPLTEPLLRSLRAEPDNARIIIQDAARADVALVLSMRGFARAHAALAAAPNAQRR